MELILLENIINLEILVIRLRSEMDMVEIIYLNRVKHLGLIKKI